MDRNLVWDKQKLAWVCDRCDWQFDTPDLLEHETVTETLDDFETQMREEFESHSCNG